MSFDSSCTKLLHSYCVIFTLSLIYLFACDDPDASKNTSSTMQETDMEMSLLGGMMNSTMTDMMVAGESATPLDMNQSWSDDMQLDMQAGTQAGTQAGMQQPDMMPPNALCVSGPLPSSQASLDLSPRCRTGNQALTIHDIRNPACPDYQRPPSNRPGINIELSSVVVTGIFGEDKFSVQDQSGGAFSGLWVYNSQRRDLSALQVGSLVNLRGQLISFYTLDELIIESDGIEIIGLTDPPSPFIITETDKIADQGMWAEALESVLITVQQAEVTNTAPDCPRDFDMFIVNDDLRLSIEYEADDEIARGDIIESATGILHFSFENQKLLIPNAMSMDVITCGGVPDKCEATDCPVVADASESSRLIITEIQNNPQGEDALREYVEFYNPSANPINLSNWKLQDCAGNVAPLSGSIDARGHYVVAGSRNRDQNGGVSAQAELADLFLPNGYGSVLLFDAEGTLVDQVRYEPGNDTWPDRDSGESLELIEPASDNREGSSWTAGRQRYGDGGKGSPGEAYRD